MSEPWSAAIVADIRRSIQQAAAVQAAPGGTVPPIDPPTTGPHSGGMSDLPARVEKLERDFEDMRATLGRIEKIVDRNAETLNKVMADVAETKGKVSQLPNTLHLIGFAVTVLVAAGVMKAFG